MTEWDDEELEEIFELGGDYDRGDAYRDAVKTVNIREDGCENYATKYCRRKCPLKPACHWIAIYG